MGYPRLFLRGRREVIDGCRCFQESGRTGLHISNHCSLVEHSYSPPDKLFRNMPPASTDDQEKMSSSMLKERRFKLSRYCVV
jgi:hypothetical protein